MKKENEVIVGSIVCGIIYFFLVVLTSCNPLGLSDVDFQNELNEFLHPHQQQIVDTCDHHDVITDPSFIQGWISVDEPLNTNWLIHIGIFEDSIHVGEDSLIDDKILSMLQTWRQQYAFYVDVSADSKKINIICKGTNVRSDLFSNNWKEIKTRDENPGWIQLHCWIQGKNFARTYFVFNEQSFYFGGAVKLNRALFYNTLLPSSKGANVREMPLDSGVPLDSIGQHRFWIAYLNDTLCKLIQGRVDWRFNQYQETDSLRQAYIKAGNTPIE